MCDDDDDESDDDDETDDDDDDDDDDDSRSQYQDLCDNSLSERLVSFWGHCRALLGDIVEASWALLWLSWGSLGALSGVSWGLLGSLGSLLGAILEAIDQKRG